MSNPFKGFEPTTSRAKNDGVQHLFRFENGYGASVVLHSFSYGREDGLWELAVLSIAGHGVDDYSIDYSSGLTDDVFGHLTEENVSEIIAKIRDLPRKTAVLKPKGLWQQTFDAYGCSFTIEGGRVFDSFGAVVGDAIDDLDALAKSYAEATE